MSELKNDYIERIYPSTLDNAQIPTNGIVGTERNGISVNYAMGLDGVIPNLIGGGDKNNDYIAGLEVTILSTPDRKIQVSVGRAIIDGYFFQHIIGGSLVILDIDGNPFQLPIEIVSDGDADSGIKNYIIYLVLQETDIEGDLDEVVTPRRTVWLSISPHSNKSSKGIAAVPKRSIPLAGIVVEGAQLTTLFDFRLSAPQIPIQMKYLFSSLIVGFGAPFGYGPVINHIFTGNYFLYQGNNGFNQIVVHFLFNRTPLLTPSVLFGDRFDIDYTVKGSVGVYTGTVNMLLPTPSLVQKDISMVLTLNVKSGSILPYSGSSSISLDLSIKTIQILPTSSDAIYETVQVVGAVFKNFEV